MYKTKAFIITSIIIVAAILYHFLSFLIPFTDNAMLVANVNPVAADVAGYITDIYVKNEEYVKKGQPLFRVFSEPYQLTYQQQFEELNTVKSNYALLKQQLAKDQQLVTEYKEIYGKLNLDYHKNLASLKSGGVSAITVYNLNYDRKSAFAKLQAQMKQVALDKQNLISQLYLIKADTYKANNAKVNLDETLVKAGSNGIVQNMYLSLNTPIEIHKPIFSFVDTDNLYIQANFYEIDLRNVRPGDEVYIYPRIYFGSKVYHGTVISRSWAANRQITNGRTQLQVVDNNADNWIMLPQRLPVQIKLLDYDPVHYPLPVGASCYVFIKP